MHFISRSKVFLDEEKKKKCNFPELNEEDWLCKLMFLADITAWQNQTVLSIFEQWKGFASKLNIFFCDVTPNLYKYSTFQT
ncbi:hypothetical protein PR048_025475 [Dryococelus australis]|uniref:Uncharacterized protein n=1 Tax=Dryococelus australis TaxID=614101 RepID=A0ABQ9GRE7_9NEOP|nr:hypothetical protein PR048_025475 [Dryococelus australis]